MLRVIGKGKGFKSNTLIRRTQLRIAIIKHITRIWRLDFFPLLSFSPALHESDFTLSFTSLGFCK